VIPTYRKVMVTTDFSTVGNRAIPHAYAVLPKDGGTVILCHVVEVPELPNPLYAHYSAVRVLSPTERQALRETVLRSLEALVPPEVRGQPMISTELRVVLQAPSTRSSVRKRAPSMWIFSSWPRMAIQAWLVSFLAPWPSESCGPRIARC